MLKLILYFILILFLIAIAIYIGTIILIFLALFFFIKSLINYIKSKNLNATKMRCPNCQSEDIKIQSLQTGAQTQSSFSGALGSTSFNFLGFNTIGTLNGNSSSNTSFTFKREGICQQCGFNYDYLAQEDVDRIKSNNRFALILSSIFLVLAIIFGIHFLGSASKSLDNPNTNLEENGSVWASKYTSINDFDYYIDGNNLYLKEYVGNDKKIKINSSYEINENNYDVVSFSGGVFASTDVTSVILPDTLTSMPTHTFNGSKVKYIYIPATLQMEKSIYPFTSYFHDVEIIYYGGTEDQWKKLTNNEERSRIDVKQIIYNANPIELK